MEFKFPDVGEGIGEGKLVSWKVNEGDTVEEDQVVAEVETDKAVVEIPSPTAGTIQTIHHQEGEVVKVGEPLITFGDGAAPKQPQHEQEKPGSIQVKDDDHERAPQRGTKKVESSLTPTAPKNSVSAPNTQAPAPTPTKNVESTQGPVTSHPQRVLATPSTRRVARELGIDISTIKGTGPNGRVTQADLKGGATTESTPTSQPPSQKASTESTPPAQPEQAPKEEVVAPKPAPQPVQLSAGETIPYSGIRKAIGDHMDLANAVPDVTEVARADVTDLMELREHLKEKAASQDVKLTPLALFAKATCAALRKHPVLNAHFSSENITTFPDIHLGIAVDTEKGLYVPVIQQAHAKSVLDLARDVSSLASQARDGSLPSELMSGSTFSITSIGPLRVEAFTPRLNTPEVGILGIGAIRDEPWVVDDEIQIRKIVTLSLTFDHRALDGAEAARFLTDLVQLLEDPGLLVLEGI